MGRARNLSKLLVSTTGTINKTDVGLSDVDNTSDATKNSAIATLNNKTLVAPALGIPSSGVLTNCTFPTLNQNTTGTASGLSATLAVGSGGTGAATLATNNVLLGNGTAALQAVAPGTSGNVLTSNGTTWSSTAPAAGASAITISNKTAAYTVVAGDLGTIINCTSGTFTVSLTAAATLGAGFNCWIKNYGSGAITIDANASEVIDDYFSIILRAGESVQIFCTGTAWLTNDGQYQQGMSLNRQPGAGRPVASATNSTAAGSNSAGNASQTITGSGAMALGGSYASGTDSFAAAITNNTSSYGATGDNSIAIGLRAKASGTYSIALGYEHIVSGTHSVAIGGFGANDNGVTGKFIIGSCFNAAGQSSISRIRAATTDATATVLLTGGGSASTINQVILPNNSAYAFTGTIVARQQAAGGTQSAAWKIEGLIRREGTAASTVLVASAVNTISNVPGWVIALTADTTNGGLAVTATGAASTSIKWLATINTSEVTYA